MIKTIRYSCSLLLLTIRNVRHASSSNSVNSGIGSGNGQRAQEKKREKERTREHVSISVREAWRRVCEAVLGKALGSPR